MARTVKVIKRLAIAFGLIALACFIYIILLGIDEAPPDDSDLLVTWEDIPESENAFHSFRAATEKLYWPQGDEYCERIFRLETGEAWDDALAQELLRRNQETLALFREGLARPKFQFPDPRVSPVRLVRWRCMAKFLSIRIAALFRAGKHQEAFDEAVRLVEFGHGMEHAKRGLIGSLLGLSTRTMGAARLREMLAEADLDAEELRACALRLQDCPADSAGLADAMRIGYVWDCFHLDKMVGRLAAQRRNPWAYARNPLGTVWGNFIYRPNATRRLLLQGYRSRVQDAVRPASDVQKIESQLTSPSANFKWHVIRSYASGNGIGKTLSELSEAALWGVIAGVRIDDTHFRAIQTLVALKAFKASAGQLPEALDQLVPAYLGTVPTDGMDGKPLRYSREKRIIYSVGEDLKDSGGFSKEEAREWAKANLDLKEGAEPQPWDLPDPSWPIEF